MMPLRAKVPTHKSSSFNCNRKNVYVVVTLCTFLYWQSVYLYKSQLALDRFLSAEQENSLVVGSVNATYGFTIDTVKFIVFKKLGYSQGLGNIMQGLLAAHLLGEDYNRLVCVEPSFVAFHQAFHLVDVQYQSKCRALFSSDLPRQLPKQNTLKLIDFFPPPDECELHNKMSSDIQVLYFEGNTYPRWPDIPRNYFYNWYQTNDSFLARLPYSKAPKVVVHLRSPDVIKGQEQHFRDKRDGLDNATLQALYQALPPTSYLVTNQVSWYETFVTWGHPPWHTGIQHSAIANVQWEENPFPTINKEASTESATYSQETMMWIDWYTLLQAEEVYHTASSFSGSAVHWRDIPSHIIAGSENGQLILQKESWRREETTARLLERSVKGTLVNCPGKPNIRIRIRNATEPRI